MKIYKSNKGFTLIELLVVIGILSILVVGLIVAINPQDKLNSASDARVLNDVGALARATESYSTSNSGNYPTAIGVLSTSGELKVVPVPPSGYGAAYTYTVTPAACNNTTTLCTAVVISAPLKSTKYSATPFTRWESSTGKQCQVATATTACP